MLVAVLSGFITALLYVPFGKWLKERLAVVPALLPATLFAYFLSLLPEVSAGKELVSYTPWVSSLGVDLNFRLDGLSLLFALLITGIGTLVFLYAAPYLKGHRYLDRFYAYLCMFMAAMLGLVLSDNVLLLFVFWELTSISSFFLIGFNNDSEASRKSAILALAITGGGGFLLMCGLILMGSLSGTYSVHEMLGSSDFLKNHEWYGLILILVFAGAFTKSAQFPFHFWLPGAMKAPTPVSAYLHSATMVKAGVYLLARLFPVLGGTDYWTWPLMVVGGLTMLYAAFHAVFRTDLKGILAYSTIAALGILVFLIGIGTTASLLAASVFILVHALYKAALFLITGVIDHETGTRDITRLAGLRKVMPSLAIAGVLAALSSAGLPFTFGFIGKDLIYEATLQTAGIAVILTALALTTNVFLVVAGFLAGIKPFTGKLDEAFRHVHLPHWLMWTPPLLLGVCGLVFGVFPVIADEAIIRPVVQALTGGAVGPPLKIWHGFNVVLLLSGITLLAGTLLYIVRKPTEKGLLALSRFDTLAPAHWLTVLASAINRFSVRYTSTWHSGYLRRYLLVVVVFACLLVAFRLFTGVRLHIDVSAMLPVSIYEFAIAGILIVAVFLSVTTSSRLTAVIALGVVGYCICLFFVFYSAPDLAMTQFTIDTLTVVLFVLVLFRLPSFLNFANNRVKVRDGVVSVFFGVLIAIAALQVLNEPENREISDFYGQNAYTLAKGKNVVNVILVDFRGFDTMFEIVVLSIAALGVYSLLKLRLKPSEKE